MAQWWSFDPRDNLRKTIGTARDLYASDTTNYVITVKNNYDEDVYIPLLLPGESRSGEPYPMPFIEMVLVSSPVTPHHIAGDIREQEGYIDLNIWYTNQDTVTASLFGKTIADKVVELVTTNRYSTPSVSWMEVSNDGRELNEDVGKMVVFHRVIEVYLKYFG